MNDQTGFEADAVEAVIEPRPSDVGGFEVRRALPSIKRRAVGPFVFLDQMGPALLRAGQGIDVRPHPHIGLATVTYLFEGEILHRDSLGTVAAIRPGEVNWMTAGRGIVHSERSDPALRQREARLFGVQSWVALPLADEETAPAFAHHAKDSLPMIATDGARLRLIAGALGGLASPVETFSETLYADLELAAGAHYLLPPEHEERAVLVVEGEIEIAGRSFGATRLSVLRPGRPVLLAAKAPARALLLGGAPLDGPRHLWWNFVSSSKARIEDAKADWKQGRFPSVPGESEFIPLPE